MSRVGSARAFVDRWLLVGVGALAFVVRLVPVLSGGGLAFYGRYDDSVYYSAADSFTFGRLPYKDFTLLHPPLLMLVLTPFAALGRLTTDATGLSVARLVFMGIGALNAVLVTRVARRWGRRAAVVAGLMYASWLPAVYSEQSTMLEPLGTTALCVALILLLRRDRPPTDVEAIVAGVALGLGATDKIWYLAPFAAVVGWQLAERRVRNAAWIAAAGVAAIAAVVVPFAILTRGRMWDMVMRDQLIRSHDSTSRIRRLASILGLRIFGHHHYWYVDALTIVGGLALLAACVVCARQRRGRVLVWLLAVNLAVLMQAPPYYQHYAALTAAPVTLVVAAAASRTATLPRPWRGTGFAAMLGLIAVSAVVVTSTPTGFRFPSTFKAAAPDGCTTSDSPEALIDMDRLSTDFRHGCPVPVDVSGITYDRLAGSNTYGRRFNVAWQRYLVSYLLSGSSFVVVRDKSDQLSLPSRYELFSRPVIAVNGLQHLRAGDGAAYW